MKDTFKYKGMRKNLINDLKNKGIDQDLILEAFDLVPRHYFLDNAFVEQAYSDIPFQIGSGQTISHPYTVAFQTQLLNIKKGDKVLEIGTGSAFQTAILIVLGAKVYSIERHKELYLKATSILKKLNYKAHLIFGDGYNGLPNFAPFDKIIITCGAPKIPENLISQLKIGGTMVIPIGENKEQQMKKIIKISDNNLKIEDCGLFSFVPMLSKKVK